MRSRPLSNETRQEVTRSRLTLMLLTLVLTHALVVSGCAPKAAVPESADPARAEKPPTQQQTTRPTEPAVTTVAVEAFASPEEPWFDRVASVTIRGSDLVVRVKRGTTEDQIAAIAVVAEESRERGLDVSRYSILYDESGYMGKYGAIY